jgi:hypothetical protein
MYSEKQALGIVCNIEDWAEILESTKNEKPTFLNKNSINLILHLIPKSNDEEIRGFIRILAEQNMLIWFLWRPVIRRNFIFIDDLKKRGFLLSADYLKACIEY